MLDSTEKIEITLRKSLIGTPLKIKKVLVALGLRHINQKVSRVSSPTILGMVRKVQHMVTTEKSQR
ncbi:MAG: 50S ribosomal protein L30 [Leptospirales bacterium]